MIGEVKRVDGDDETLYPPAAESIKQHVNGAAQYLGLRGRLSHAGQTWTPSLLKCNNHESLNTSCLLSFVPVHFDDFC